MSIRVRFNKLSAMLAEELPPEATTIPLVESLKADDVEIDTLPSGFFLPMTIDHEVIYVTAYTKGSLTATITRGEEGTDAALHSSGAILVNGTSAYEGDLAYSTSRHTDLRPVWLRASSLGKIDLPFNVVVGWLEPDNSITPEDAPSRHLINGVLTPTAIGAKPLTIRITQYNLAPVDLNYSIDFPFALPATGTLASVYIDGVLADSMVGTDPDGGPRSVRIPRGAHTVDFRMHANSQIYRGPWLTPVGEVPDPYTDNDGIHYPNGFTSAVEDGLFLVGINPEAPQFTAESGGVVVGQHITKHTWPESGMFTGPPLFYTAVGLDAGVGWGAAVYGQQAIARDYGTALGTQAMAPGRADTAVGYSITSLPKVGSDAFLTPDVSASTAGVVVGGISPGTWYVIVVAKSYPYGPTKDPFWNWGSAPVTVSGTDTQQIGVTVTRLNSVAGTEVAEYEIWLATGYPGSNPADTMQWVTTITADGSASYSYQIVAPPTSPVLSTNDFYTQYTSTLQAGGDYGHSGTFTGESSVMVGSEMNADNHNRMIIIGNNADVRDSEESIIIGWNTWMSDSYESVAVGDANGSGYANVAIGTSAETYGNGAALTGAQKSVAVGYNSYTEGPNTVALGSGTYSSNQSNVVVGNDSSAYNQYDVAIGTNAYAQGGDDFYGDGTEPGGSIAIGYGSSTGDPGAVCIGQDSSAYDARAVAVGQDAAADLESVSLGYGAVTYAEKCVAIGAAADVESDRGMAIGTSAYSDGEDSVAIGSGARVEHQKSVAIGAAATSTAPNQVVLGTETEKVLLPGAQGSDKIAAELVTSGAGIVLRSPNGTRYLLTVDDAGELATTAIPAATVPDAPTTVTAVAVAPRVMDVSFAVPASDGHTAITNYVVTASPGGATGEGTSSPIRVEGLNAGTSYTFTVVAQNSVGASSASTASSPVSTPAATVPGTPTLYSAKFLGNYGFIIQALAPENDGGAAITLYKVKVDGVQRLSQASPYLWVSGYWQPGDTRAIEITATNAVGVSSPLTFNLTMPDWKN